MNEGHLYVILRHFNFVLSNCYSGNERRTTRSFVDSDDPARQISIRTPVSAELQIRYEHVLDRRAQAAQLPRKRHA